MDKPGYHLVEIPKGSFGGFSKIEEEIAELQDAHEQGSEIMELIEMSDLIGAIEAYADQHFNISFDQLLTFKKITARAFKNGHR